jgi:FtsP/CotA-like multicopper oxidase with cupredoxin domain
MRHWPGRFIGIAALLAAVSLAPSSAGPGAQAPVVRRYYVAAEEVVWDYAPGGASIMAHGNHAAGIPAPWGANRRWKKVRYIEYTDDTFTTSKPQPAWLGILGPIIRAEVGDTVLVHFLNRTDDRHSMHPHGVRYTKDHEGADYAHRGAGAVVPPGGRHVYTWIADEGAAPGPSDPSSVVWWYHAHLDEPAETNAGLLGPIIITARGMARPDAAPVDVDRELVLMFMIFDEAKGEERGLMHSVNGFIFGNVPDLVMKSGERVRWHLLGMGNEKDLHTAHWHGKTLRSHGRNTDVIELLPAGAGVRCGGVARLLGSALS